MQDINRDQLKLKVNDTCKKDEKKSTNVEPSNDEDGSSKAYLDENLSELGSQVFYLKEDYNEFILHNNNQSVEENLIETAVKTTMQTFYDKGLFENYNYGNAYEVLKVLKDPLLKLTIDVDLI